MQKTINDLKPNSYILRFGSPQRVQSLKAEIYNTDGDVIGWSIKNGELYANINPLSRDTEFLFATIEEALESFNKFYV